jgi:hypothetical protein
MPFLSHPKSKGEKKENWLFMKTMSEGPWQLSGQWEATDESFSKSPFPGG